MSLIEATSQNFNGPTTKLSFLPTSASRIFNFDLFPCNMDVSEVVPMTPPFNEKFIVGISVSSHVADVQVQQLTQLLMHSQ